MDEKQNFVLPMRLQGSSWYLPLLNTQRSSSRFILRSIKLPDPESQKKATLHYGAAKIIPLRLSRLLNFFF